VGQINGVHFISMSFIDGKTLSKVIADSQLSEDEAAVILAKTARGIQKAHERGVIHRDLKPDNIMIDLDGEPVVMDFGLAIRNNEEGADARLTNAGALVGSPAYMSPEQAEGKTELIGPSSDIYSLGVVLYQMLTQTVPFDGSITSVLRQIASDPPAPPSSHNASLAGSRIEKICLTMLEKSPSDRFPCMGDVAEAAEECHALALARSVGRRKRRSFWPFGKRASSNQV
jgi:serine/threonine protein kinase